MGKMAFFGGRGDPLKKRILLITLPALIFFCCLVVI